MYIEHVIIKVAIIVEIVGLIYVAEIERYFVARVTFAIEILLDLTMEYICDVAKLCIFCSRISRFCRERVVDLVFRRCLVSFLCEVDISCLRVISEEFLIWRRERVLSRRLKPATIWRRKKHLIAFLTIRMCSEALLQLLLLRLRKKTSLCRLEASLICSLLFVMLIQTLIVFNDLVQ